MVRPKVGPVLELVIVNGTAAAAGLECGGCDEEAKHRQGASLSTQFAEMQLLCDVGVPGGGVRVSTCQSAARRRASVHLAP